MAIQTDNAITLYTSLDGLAWNRSALPAAQYLSPETIFTMTMVVAPRGPGLVAVTWGQYARGGVFAAVSLDGGVTWGQEERIAQHNLNGRAFENQGEGSPRAGFDPWVVYDAVTDQLAVSWTEMDGGRKPRTFTTMYAIRALADSRPPVALRHQPGDGRYRAPADAWPDRVSVAALRDAGWPRALFVGRGPAKFPAACLCAAAGLAGTAQGC